MRKEANSRNGSCIVTRKQQCRRIGNPSFLGIEMLTERGEREQR